MATIEFGFMDCMITFALAFIITFSATPIAKRISMKAGAVDYPKDRRRMHKEPIARLGGIAIIAGFTVAVLFVFFTALLGNSEKDIVRQLLGIMAGMSIIAAIGITDDIKKLGPWPKLSLQIIAALVTILISGLRITIFSNPFSASLPYVVIPGYISYPLTVLWIVAITNAINLIDGLDGLAAGVTAISCISLFFINLFINKDLSIMPFVSVLILALAGSSIGFLPFNFYPAKIIMGDTGAYFLGFMLSIISIQGALKSYTVLSISVPLLVLGLPVIDTVASIFRRIKTHKSIVHADRGHIHHRLIDMGLSIRQAVITLYIASAGLGIAAIVMAERGVMSAVIFIVMVSLFVISGAYYLRDIDSVPAELKVKGAVVEVPGDAGQNVQASGEDADGTGKQSNGREE